MYVYFNKEITKIYNIYIIFIKFKLIKFEYYK